MLIEELSIQKHQQLRESKTKMLCYFWTPLSANKLLVINIGFIPFEYLEFMGVSQFTVPCMYDHTCQGSQYGWLHIVVAICLKYYMFEIGL